MTVDLTHTCSECSTLVGPKATTCSPRCRGKRARRLARQNKLAKQRQVDGVQKLVGPGTKAFQRLTDEMEDAARDVMRQELVPIVREAITEDTLRAIRDLVALSPRMVAAIEADLEHHDPIIRQKAYTLLMRYTVGHQALVRPEDESANNQMTVVFAGMERPSDTPTEAEAEEEAQVIRKCNGCGQGKPITEFVGHSDRCSSCHEALKQRAERILND